MSRSTGIRPMDMADEGASLAAALLIAACGPSVGRSAPSQPQASATETLPPASEFADPCAAIASDLASGQMTQDCAHRIALNDCVDRSVGTGPNGTGEPAPGLQGVPSIDCAGYMTVQEKAEWQRAELAWQRGSERARLVYYSCVLSRTHGDDLSFTPEQIDAIWNYCEALIPPS